MKTLFHSAAIKLTLAYLGIIMILSISFSTILYRVSSQELDRSLRRPQTIIRTPFGDFDFDAFRRERLAESNQHLKANLVLINVFTLVAGGALSYALARKSLQPIEETLEKQSRFTADASHELRTPLTAMQTEIEVALRNKKLSLPEAKDLLTSNLEEVAKLRTLSDSLLQLARHGTEQLQTSSLQLQTIIETALKRLKAKAESKNIHLTAKVDTSLKVKANETALTEILTILLDNAVKYSHPKADVQVTATMKGAETIIKVIDQGQGINEQDLPHIFERFYRADSSRTRQHSDSYGLGLSIAKELIERQAGRISVTSKPGHGATFAVHIPTAKN